MIATSKMPSRTIEAALNFLVPSTNKPRVLMPVEPADRIERTGAYRAINISIHDARDLPESPTLDREGFALLAHLSAVTDFFAPTVVERLYYPEVVELLERATGASEVYIFDHTVRAEGDGVQGRQYLRSPVSFVHNDYTERSAIQRVLDIFAPEKAASLLAGRLAFVNVWRSIGASAERFPLAAADGRSMRQDDFVAVDMVYADRTGEIYHNVYSSGQRWFYFAGMQKDEVMLLKCFDSATDGRTKYTAHTGFANPLAAAGTPTRQSIEVRAILAFAG